MNFTALTDPVTPAYLMDVLGWRSEMWLCTSPVSEANSNLYMIYDCTTGMFGLPKSARMKLPTVGHLLAMCWSMQIPIPKGVCK